MLTSTRPTSEFGRHPCRLAPTADDVARTARAMADLVVESLLIEVHATP